MAEPRKCPVYASCIIATGLAVSIGISFGWTSPVEEKLLKGGFGFPISVYEYSWVASAYPLGGLISCIPSGFLIDILGRQFSLVLVIMPQAFGWFLIRIAQDIWMLCFGRLILGMVGGVLYVAIPLYTSEIAQKENRGSLGMLFQLQSCAGILLVYILGAFMDLLSLTMVSLVVPLMLSALAMHIPESPMFLLQKGREKEATKMLKTLRGSQYDVQSELAAMKDEYDSWLTGRRTYYARLTSRACLKALYITCGLMCFQQLCGMGVIMFYATGIFVAAKTKEEPRYATITIGVVQFITMLALIFLADNMGRRFCLMFSSAVIAVAHFTLALYFLFLQKDDESMDSAHWLPIVSLCVFVGFFSLGFGSIPLIIVGEIFPPHIKGVASSIPISIFWFLTFCTTKLYVDVTVIGVHVAFFFFSASTVVAFVFVFLFVPETRGKSLNEIIKLLEGNKS